MIKYFIVMDAAHGRAAYVKAVSRFLVFSPLFLFLLQSSHVTNVFTDNVLPLFRCGFNSVNQK